MNTIFETEFDNKKFRIRAKLGISGASTIIAVVTVSTERLDGDTWVDCATDQHEDLMHAFNTAMIQKACQEFEI